MVFGNEVKMTSELNDEMCRALRALSQLEREHRKVMFSLQQENHHLKLKLRDYVDSQQELCNGLVHNTPVQSY